MKDQIKGKAEEWKGKVTGDKGEEMKGKARQAAGDVKRAARDVRDDVKEGVERHKTEHELERERRMRGDENYREPGPGNP
ncbi:MAG TPA: CsbD family protein [Candidatus Dormibacteraeota bacterium]|nr:CsbD family protein [Candidatus Dormibacteraeota bacterium]